MKALHQLTVKQRDAMKQRFNDFNQRWLKLIEIEAKIEDSDREIMSSLAYQMHSKKVLSEKQLLLGERIIIKYANSEL